MTTRRYSIISADTLEELINKVNVALDLGHTLLGGISFDKINRPYQACSYEIVEQQAALLKPTKKEKKND